MICGISRYNVSGKLGKYEILDNKIICHVKEKKLRKIAKENANGYIFELGSLDSEYKVLAYDYNLKMPIYYVIENMTFDKPISVNGSFRHSIIFKNCAFTEKIDVHDFDDVVFEYNMYLTKEHLFRNYKNSCFVIKVQGTKNVKFISLGIINADLLLEGRKIEFVDTIINIYNCNMKIDASDVNISSSSIESKGMVINARNINVVSSKINSDSMEVGAANIVSYNSSIYSSVVSLEDVRNYKLFDISCDSMFIDGIEVNPNSKNYDNDNLKLQKKRLELLHTLKKIKISCDDTIDDKLQQTMLEMKNKPLNRILKK